MVYANLLLSSFAALVFGSLVHAQDGSFQAQILVPAGNVEYMRTRGVGSYNYNCFNKRYQFTNATGEILEFNNRSVRLGAFSYFPLSSVNGMGAVIDVHGSSVRLQQIATGPSGDPTRDLPNALFYATSAADGDLKGTTFVQQIYTFSGVGSTKRSSCDRGDTQFVTFRADYVFYKTNGSAAIPSKIRVPPGNVELLRAHGAGTYNYRCQNNMWAFVGMKGDLSQIDNNSVQIGSFFLRDTPDANGGSNVFKIDDSRVYFKTNQTADTRIPGSIPDVLYSTTSTTVGKLQKVTFGQRLNALGGNVPTTPCSRPSDDVQVPFSADYYFYVKG